MNRNVKHILCIAFSAFVLNACGDSLFQMKARELTVLHNIFKERITERNSASDKVESLEASLDEVSSKLQSARNREEWDKLASHGQVGTSASLELAHKLTTNPTYEFHKSATESGLKNQQESIERQVSYSKEELNRKSTAVRDALSKLDEALDQYYSIFRTGTKEVPSTDIQELVNIIHSDIKGEKQREQSRIRLEKITSELDKSISKRK